MRLFEGKSRLSLISFIWSSSVGEADSFSVRLCDWSDFLPFDWSEGCINLAALAWLVNQSALYALSLNMVH